MARSFVRASSQYLEVASPVVVAYPFTMACWFYPLDTTGGALIGISDTAGTSNYWYLDHTTAVRILARDNSTSDAANATGSVVTNAWNHAAGVFTSSTSRSAFFNGSGKSTATGNITPVGLDVTTVGTLHRSVFGSYENGRIAEPAIWNVALTDVEIAALARGLHPSRIRPDALVAYWPLWGDDSPEPDWHTAGGTRYPLTVTGATKANHAPVEPRARLWWGSLPLIEASANQTVSPPAIVSLEAFGSAVLTPGEVSLSPSSIGSAETFGTSVLTTGSVTLSPSGIDSGEAFGDTVVSPGGVRLNPDPIGSEEAFGTAVVSVGVLIISPSGIESAETFGLLTVSPGLVIVSPSGITSLEAFGTATVGELASVPTVKQPTNASLSSGGATSATLSTGGATSAEID
jgi:hypothetical protein